MYVCSYVGTKEEGAVIGGGEREKERERKYNSHRLMTILARLTLR